MQRNNNSLMVHDCLTSVSCISVLHAPLALKLGDG